MCVPISWKVMSNAAEGLGLTKAHMENAAVKDTKSKALAVCRLKEILDNISTHCTKITRTAVLKKTIQAFTTSSLRVRTGEGIHRLIMLHGVGFSDR